MNGDECFHYTEVLKPEQTQWRVGINQADCDANDGVIAPPEVMVAKIEFFLNKGFGIRFQREQRTQLWRIVSALQTIYLRNRRQAELVYGQAVAQKLLDFMLEHYGYEYWVRTPGVILDDANRPTDADLDYVWQYHYKRQRLHPSFQHTQRIVYSMNTMNQQ